MADNYMAPSPSRNAATSFGAYLPPEYGTEMLAANEAARTRSEEEQLRSFIENMNALGRTYSGSTLRTAINTLLGPAMERRQENIRNISLQGAQAGREERLIRARQQYEQGESARARAFEMEKMREQEAIQSRLLRLKADLTPERGFWDEVGSGFAKGLGEGVFTGVAGGGLGLLGDYGKKMARSMYGRGQG